METSHHLLWPSCLCDQFRALDKRECSVIIWKFLLILHKSICCDPSSEPSRRDGSDEGSQHMVSMRNKKKYLSVTVS